MAWNAKAMLAFTLAVALVLAGAPLYAGQPAHTDTSGMETNRIYTHKKAMAPKQPTDEGRAWDCPCSRKIAIYHQLRGTQAIVGDTDYQARRTAQGDTGQQSIVPDNKLRKLHIR